MTSGIGCLNINTAVKDFAFLLYRKIMAILSGHGIGKIPGLSPISKFVFHLLKPSDALVLVNTQGSKLYVSSRDADTLYHSLLTTGFHEKYCTKLLMEIVKPGMVVVDIGAHAGYFTLLASKLVGKAGKVYAFEPSPRNYELLEKNIKLNGYTNIFPMKKAVSNKCERTRLFIDRTDSGGHSLSERNVEGENDFVEVDTIVLGELFKDSPLDIIKIDAEGAEGVILDGASKILKRNRELKIIMEFNPSHLKNMGTDALKFFNDLNYNYGYYRIGLIDEAHQAMSVLTIEEIAKICEGGETFNILLEK